MATETPLLRQSIFSLLKERAEETPDLMALSEGEVHWTYRDLDRESDRFAARLAAAGAGSGSSIALITYHSKETVALLYGALKLGAVVSLVAATAVEKTLEYMLSCVNADFVVSAAPAIRAKLSAGRRAYCLYPGTDGFLRLPQPSQNAAGCIPDREETDIDRSGIVLFTSGTTAMPKAVLLTQYRLVNNANSHRMIFKADEKDRFVACLPLDHILGVIVTMLTPLMAGAAMCLTKDIHTDSILHTIEKEHCSIICGVPSMFHALVGKEALQKYDISSLRYGLTGGSACSEALFKETEKKLGITLISTLGQTETTGGFTMPAPDETRQERWTSVGIAGFHSQVKLIDGEICVKGYQVSDGYLNKPEATAKLIDGDGWLHTGDIGRIDEKGIIYVIGRKKAIIIRSGENISASQVAGVLEAMEGIGECVVIGVPDEHRGEEVCACIIRDDPSLTQEQIRAYAREHLEHFKEPRYLLFYESFPRTDVGKVKVQELKADAIRKISTLDE